jgi:acyl transferase domain-containing protein
MQQVSDMCFTAAVARTHLDDRVVLIGRSSLELAEAAAAYHAGGAHAGILTRGGATSGDADLGEPEASIARDYVAGAAVDWSGVYHPGEARKVSLPRYPWQRQRFWLEPNITDQTPTIVR